ncbi:hypothetical protein BD779DRAFT_1705744 [Infundibulicybe gibba]|nr:hypothetical protein BD779DRAFT_1705744 [Infundibulicybe gibba]
MDWELVPEMSQLYSIWAGKLYDPYSRSLLLNRIITINRDTGVIQATVPLREAFEAWFGSSESLDDAELQEAMRNLTLESHQPLINWETYTIVPGFVDVHVHLFLHSYAETSWEDQLTKEHIAERTLRASAAARTTLRAGFTTVRDLGTEGAGDADIALRKCISTNIIEGPRYFCANRAIVSTGSYGPKSAIHLNEEGVEGVMGAEVADGKVDCIRAVRRQIGAGADWVKVSVYINIHYRVRSRMSNTAPDIGSQAIPTFNRGELEAMVTAAHSSGVKVAAHVMRQDVIKTLLELGVDTIEHGADIYSNADESVLHMLIDSKKTTWVPTLAAYYTLAERGLPGADMIWENAQKAFVKAAVELKMENIACGGDTGVFPHGENALEMALMVKLGVGWERVLRWATLGGWECIRGMEWEGPAGIERLKQIESGALQKGLGERGIPFGAVRKGWAADMVVISGKLDGTPDEFSKAVREGIRFVVKGGHCLT